MYLLSLKTKNLHEENQSTKNFFWCPYFLINLKGKDFLNIIPIFSQTKKRYSIILDSDPNWANIQDPDPNSMYLDKEGEGTTSPDYSLHLLVSRPLSTLQ